MRQRDSSPSRTAGALFAIAGAAALSACSAVPGPRMGAAPPAALNDGVASYYGDEYAGRPTASGERYDPGAMTAAHRTLPFGTIVRVTDPATGRSVTVRINDRGPFRPGRVIDLSYAAAAELGLIRRGIAPVTLALVDR
ncbi:septal ring lytic transglycosylase RlpA family protein [Sphingosinithalassobacter sp. CS137]|uniref:septal ring lytic transglycosylase RlpA family protein n=1 Tax=Sphingosinithalassobacter sp. CS137 TaxID=2762748 RepID=UPI00165DA784|nr:septal ring lytic transglycosylase RlpA family protein [Sphingosinithalassobacter sp. CS137]